MAGCPHPFANSRSSKLQLPVNQFNSHQELADSLEAEYTTHVSFRFWLPACRHDSSSSSLSELAFSCAARRGLDWALVPREPDVSGGAAPGAADLGGASRGWVRQLCASRQLAAWWAAAEGERCTGLANARNGRSGIAGSAAHFYAVAPGWSG